MARVLISPSDKSKYFIKFNVDGLLRGDYQSRMSGYATARQNGWMSGNLYLTNGNMTKLADAGLFGKKVQEENEEVLELEEQDSDESGNTDGNNGTNTVSERHNRRRELV